MSTAEALSFDSVEYLYNKVGTVRAVVQKDGSMPMLEMKLVEQSYATPDSLVSLGGEAAEARAAGFILGYKPASSLGIETLNELTGQWRPISTSGTFAVVAMLPE